ncbi:hypothetical protein [Bosea sp. CS1GBMeth4]|uniref:hypothetical protein n=1 Tax=Bosea sp. CS1GBMeth4 TaxID=1892849 RepID=UPI0016490CA6|nr:hypothetical protein [Bosea sp. CS1GBMeth4]
MTDNSDKPLPIEAKLAEYGLKVGPETLAALKGAVTDLETAARSIRVKRSYLQEPAHTLRLWTK